MDKQTKISFTADELKLLRQALGQTWQAVCSDMPEDCDNEQAIEVALDADYMDHYAPQFAAQAHALINRVTITNSWSKLLKYLSKNITIV